MVVIENRSAYHEYFVEDTLECGISLRGNEVKSIRAGKANIKESWCQVQNGQLMIRGMFISKWDTANAFDVDERRERVLLAHKSEINKLSSKVSEKGLTLVPLRVYFVKGKCKILVGVCRGKKLYDKRETLKSKQVAKDISRELKNNNR